MGGERWEGGSEKEEEWDMNPKNAFRGWGASWKLIKAIKSLPLYNVLNYTKGGQQKLIKIVIKIITQKSKLVKSKSNLPKRRLLLMVDFP